MRPCPKCERLIAEGPGPDGLAVHGCVPTLTEDREMGPEEFIRKTLGATFERVRKGELEGLVGVAEMVRAAAAAAEALHATRELDGTNEELESFFGGQDAGPEEEDDLGDVADLGPEPGPSDPGPVRADPPAPPKPGGKAGNGARKGARLAVAGIDG